MTGIAVNERFVVTQVTEARTPKGKLLARYLPGMDYRVTARNLELVAGYIAKGTARLGTTTNEEKLAAAKAAGGIGMNLQAGLGRVSGSVKIGG